jgi:hypothetical protein
LKSFVERGNMQIAKFINAECNGICAVSGKDMQGIEGIFPDSMIRMVIFIGIHDL